MQIKAPLNRLLKKNMPQDIDPFGNSELKALNTLMEAITILVGMAVPWKGLEYSVDTDASDHHVGAQRFQTDRSGEREPLRYW